MSLPVLALDLMHFLFVRASRHNGTRCSTPSPEAGSAASDARTWTQQWPFYAAAVCIRYKAETGRAQDEDNMRAQSAPLLTT
jgi:hypothetical protein